MSKKEPFNLLKVREYTDGNGEVKKIYTRVGVAFQVKDGGFSIKIDEGIALIGDALILPRKEREDGPTTRQNDRSTAHHNRAWRLDPERKAPASRPDPADDPARQAHLSRLCRAGQRGKSGMGHIPADRGRRPCHLPELESGRSRPRRACHRDAR